MRLSLLYCPRLLKEYGGLDYGRINLDTALDEAAKDKTSLIAIQCPQSGWWAKDFNKSSFHSKLIRKAQDQGIRDVWHAVRAYWVPLTGKLMLYQMETPNGKLVDPSEEIITKLADNLRISKEIMSIDIIE